jgi:hypothetical protein
MKRVTHEIFVRGNRRFVRGNRRFVRGNRRLTVVQSRAARLVALILSIFNSPALVFRGREGEEGGIASAGGSS